MPRGVAIPEIRQQLFAAAECVIIRDGPAKLSGRAVTTEAGVATGLLYGHFTDFDEFLAAYAIDRAFLISAQAAALPERAGTDTVAGNLCDAVLSIPLTPVLVSARLLVTRPELRGRIHAVLGDKTTGLDAIENAAATYLAEEQRLGRIAATADPETLALALVGVLHHLVLGADTESDVHARIQRTITALIRDLSAVTHSPGKPT
ncbi:AcrR family transcriptional regulator [Kibdelosporangium banguiense]|uniref:AcrR family transcriptional regulator n=1 Tax=Kibdelosporangium banguiense TaxID=1365924 RepID=A0ABS4T8V3_9PSEU|nr:TetR/AcrR family transcriptional regulator [Kibdelosporangium banguiense]MBP2320364.1 AcrR family transcriptional regulator [Kibdelosporangium banguiense]